MKYIKSDSIQPFVRSPKAKVSSPPTQYNQIFMDSIGGDSLDKRMNAHEGSHMLTNTLRQSSVEDRNPKKNYH